MCMHTCLLSSIVQYMCTRLCTVNRTSIFTRQCSVNGMYICARTSVFCDYVCCVCTMRRQCTGSYIISCMYLYATFGAQQVSCSLPACCAIMYRKCSCAHVQSQVSVEFSLFIFTACDDVVVSTVPYMYVY